MNNFLFIILVGLIWGNFNFASEIDNGEVESEIEANPESLEKEVEFKTIDEVSEADLSVALMKESEYCSRMDLVDKVERIGLLKNKLLADKILISKSQKKIYLLNKGRVLSEYSVSFGFGFTQGAKQKKGDGRTPEGTYKIELKNSKSAYYKALKISYPNAEDLARLSGSSIDPGNDIMIHGFPNQDIGSLKRSYVQKNHLSVDWTQGCVAVTNSEIDQIYSLVSEGTVVEICPLGS